MFCHLQKRVGAIACPIVTTLFGNPKGPHKLGNPNTCAKVKLC